ncbi:hypothetical protein [Verrucomicrobium spinosum]|uniref:hypothetical protein n=1 Tax=Verrucomicrobium spinosum TaxID=2736 RepID=UPI0012E277B8|nr:hypothetical protein [Verrucomicrobium spinosum]
MNVADLLKVAETATPEVQSVGKKWATMLPVFIQLRGKGFSRRQSIEWLVKQGAMKLMTRGERSRRSTHCSPAARSW